MAAVVGGGGSLAGVFFASWTSWLVGGLLFLALLVVSGVLWAVFSQRDEPFARVTELARMARGDAAGRTPDGVDSPGNGSVTR
ncbi:hypothetical protein [Lentzea sp. CA-135723]|uniref:hypothetical protein n=1 Tax=Lentzea sp. CA-135723 TaxID=3239950 RepID=UPI003D8ADDED